MKTFYLEVAIHNMMIHIFVTADFSVFQTKYATVLITIKQVNTFLNY